jgi:hypothetical protein
MKKILQSVLYLIIVILMLEVIKTVVVKKGGMLLFYWKCNSLPADVHTNRVCFIFPDIQMA